MAGSAVPERVSAAASRLMEEVERRGLPLDQVTRRGVRREFSDLSRDEWRRATGLAAQYLAYG